MKLMIIESPNKKKKLSGILGSDWVIEASVGHIRDLPQKEIGVDMESFRPTYEVSKGKEAVVSKLKSLVKKADQVYLATDPDREGEAISWHLKEALGIKSYQRVTFNAITAAAVKAAVASPRQIDGRLVAAQECRRVLDRLVGYPVSSWLCRRLDAPVSAGRVQTPALRIVVERCIAIRNFKSVDHLAVQLDMGGWTANWHFKPLLPAVREHDYWLDRPTAEKAAAVRQLVVREYREGPKRRAPPAPFTTSTLQQAASVQYKFSTKKTMELAQNLFAAGHITYHRTDSPNLSSEAVQEIRKLAQENNWPIPDSPRVFHAKESAQEAHEAIRPTHLEYRELPASVAADERKLYQLIWLRAVASQLADAVYLSRQVAMEGDGFIYLASGRKLTDPGWLALLGGDETVEDDDKDDGDLSNAIPPLSEGQSVTAVGGKIIAKKTEPPKAYTEAQLVKKLESDGVGRPSTYASIIETIKKREYVRLEKNRLFSTPVGEMVVSELAKNFRFADVGYTRDVETMLDGIAMGEMNYVSVLQTLNSHLEEEMKEAGKLPPKGQIGSGKPKPKAELPVHNGPIPDCPECQSKMVLRAGKFGPFWSCQHYPNCKGMTKYEKH